MGPLSHLVCYPGTHGALCCFQVTAGSLLVKAPTMRKLLRLKRRRESFTTRGWVSWARTAGLGWVGLRGGISDEFLYKYLETQDGCKEVYASNTDLHTSNLTFEPVQRCAGAHSSHMCPK